MVYLNWFADHTLDLTPIRDNDFALCFLLDIGLTMQSIHLAQVRVAPIQISGTVAPLSNNQSSIPPGLPKGRESGQLGITGRCRLWTSD